LYIDIASKKHLATKEERNPSLKFVHNRVLMALSSSKALEQALKERKINNWQQNDDIILYLIESIKDSKLYQNYMKVPTSSFEEDRNFLAELYTEIIAPSEKLYDYLEDHKLTWLDDLPGINTLILKQIKQLKSETDSLIIPEVYKDDDDKEFVTNLFRKTVLNEVELSKEYIDKTPNWDVDRIAEIDTIILKMAICELLKFPSIPTKVTINEYLEIAKEYSTPKSSIFINGILDNLVKEFEKDKRLTKSGRGLL
jgi:N utilization substance protein B